MTGPLGHAPPRLPRALFAAGLATWVSLAWAFGRWDLAISLAVADPASAWGAFVARWGELPGVVTALAAMALLGASSSAVGARRGAAVIGAGAGCVALATYGVGVVAARDGWEAYLGGGGLLVAGAAALVTAAGLVAARRRRVVLSPRALRFARVTVAAALIALAVVMAAKLLWGRVRFRDLEVGLEAFTAWYAPQGPNGHTSFPSGHTLWGWVALTWVLLVPRGRPTRRAAVAALAVAWGLAVAAGRVMVGAHYASDVLFSTGVVVAALAFVSRRRVPRVEGSRRD